MSDVMDPATVPADPTTGVVRLNKVPLIAVICILGIAVLSIVYALYGRSNPAPPPGPQTGEPQVQEAGAEATQPEVLRLESDRTGIIPADDIDVFPEYVIPPEQPTDSVTEESSPSPEFVLPSFPATNPTDTAPPADIGGAAQFETVEMVLQAMESDTRISVNAGYNQPPPREQRSDNPLLNGDLERLLAAQAQALGDDIDPTGTATEADPNLRTRKQEFLDQSQGQEETYQYSPYTRQQPQHPTILTVGMVINAVMITDINSDLPGLMIAQVTRPVYDAQTGRLVLIPQGAKLIGEYDSHIAQGQKRLLVVWNRVQFPDASTMSLPFLPGGSPSGAAGLKDKYHSRFLSAFASASLISIIGASAQLSQPDDSGTDRNAQSELTASLGREWADVGRESITRQFDVQPTLTIRKGFRFVLHVTHDIALDPYKPRGTR